MYKCLAWLVETDRDPSRIVLRLGVGGVIFAHGAQKLFGWFGGPGFAGSMDHFTQSMGIPAVLAFLAIMAESVGSLALVIGFLTRVAALGIGVVMAVAIIMVHAEVGFFMNWSGQQSGEGFEYHLLVLAMVILLVWKGGGRWSLDGIVQTRLIGSVRQVHAGETEQAVRSQERPAAVASNPNLQERKKTP